MNLASLSVLPSTFVLLTRSEPARSTRLSFDLPCKAAADLSASASPGARWP